MCVCDCVRARLLDDPAGVAKVYRAVDAGDAPFVSMLQSHCPAKQSINLKIGCQVGYFIYLQMRVCVYMVHALGS